jgi:cytochrome P450
MSESSPVGISASHVATIAGHAGHADRPTLDAAFAWLRQNDPLARGEVLGYEPFWVVTKHADILTVSKDNKRFPYGDRPSTFIDREGEIAMRTQPVRTLVQMDEPDHMKYRLLTQTWFMPKNIKALEPRIRELARQSVAQMQASGNTCDFAAEIALHYPLHVIMEIFGIPPDDEPRMLQLTQQLFGNNDPDLQRKKEADTPEQEVARQQAVMMDFFAYFNSLIEARRAEPRQDVASVIANSQISGEPIPVIEAMAYFMLLATAGHDTTSATTAGALWALAERPVEYDKLKKDLALIPSFVDESIRWASPVRHFMRSSAEDTELRGQKIAKGDWLMLCYPSGNRDEEVFEAPGDFRVDRSPNQHLAFGYGAHVCIGMHLAKMEMRILWEELLPRLQALAPAGEAKFSRSNFVSRLKSAPIRYHLAGDR